MSLVGKDLEASNPPLPNPLIMEAALDLQQRDKKKQYFLIFLMGSWLNLSTP